MSHGLLGFCAVLAVALADHTPREISTIAGGCFPKEVIKGTGCDGTSGLSDGLGTESAFTNPTSLTLDYSPEGRPSIYVADTGNHVIRMLRLDGVDDTEYNVTTIAGSGVRGYADGRGRAARFNYPKGIVAWSPQPLNIQDGRDQNMLFVADSGNHAVRRLVLTFAFTGELTECTVDTLAGAEAQGPYPSVGVPGLVDATGSAARFFDPVDLEIVRTLPTERFDFSATPRPGLVDNFDFSLLVVDKGNNLIRSVARGGKVETYSGRLSSPLQSYDAPDPHCNEMTKADDEEEGYVIHNTSLDRNALCLEWGSVASISSYRRWTNTSQPRFQDGLRTRVFDDNHRQLMELHQPQNLALKVTGQNDYVKVLPKNNWKDNTQMTVELWVKPEDGHVCSSGFCTVWSQVNNDVRNAGLALESPTEGDGDPDLWDKYIAVGGSLWKRGCDATDCVTVNGVKPYKAPVPIQVWSHIALVMRFAINDGDSTCHVYRNGELVLEFGPDQIDNFNTNSFTGNLRVGGAIDAGGENIRGIIDEFRVWTFAKTAAEIKEDMYRVLDPNFDSRKKIDGTPTLLVYLNFDNPDEILTGNEADLENRVKSVTPWSNPETDLAGLTEFSWVVSSVGFGYAAKYTPIGGGNHGTLNFDGGRGTNITLGRSAGLAHNPAGQLYICDWEAGIVRQHAPESSTVEWYAGIKNLSAPTFESRFAHSVGLSNFNITMAQFNLLYGIAIPPTQYSDYRVAPTTDPDPDGVSWKNHSEFNTTVVFLADTGNNLIRKITAERCEDAYTFCHGHGICGFDGMCDCAAYQGPSCTLPCPQFDGTQICNGGRCFYDEAAHEAKCDCPYGWRGRECVIQCPLDEQGFVCSNRGWCDATGSCQCPTEYWTGERCDIAVEA